MLERIDQGPPPDAEALDRVIEGFFHRVLACRVEQRTHSMAASELALEPHPAMPVDDGSDDEPAPGAASKEQLSPLQPGYEVEDWRRALVDDDILRVTTDLEAELTAHGIHLEPASDAFRERCRRALRAGLKAMKPDAERDEEVYREAEELDIRVPRLVRFC